MASKLFISLPEAFQDHKLSCQNLISVATICVWIAVNFWRLGFHFINGKLDIESQVVTWENGQITDRNVVYGWRVVCLVVNSWFTVRRLHLIIECTL